MIEKNEICIPRSWTQYLWTILAIIAFAVFGFFALDTESYNWISPLAFCVIFIVRLAWLIKNPFLITSNGVISVNRDAFKRIKWKINGAQSIEMINSNTASPCFRITLND